MTRLDRINERLNLKEFQLRALLDVTKAINNNLQREELLRLYAGIMREELGITRLLLFENSGGWRCAHAFGADESQQLLDVQPLVERYKDIQFIGSADENLISGFDIAVPVFHREVPLALLLIGDIDEEERRVSPAVKHMNFIQTLTNLIAVALENKRLGKLALQQERDKRELELAAEMQTMLIPRDLPNDASVQAAAWYLPHRQVGGDYYDVIRLNERELVLCVADVSGKGIAAAMLMSNFQATLRAMLLHDHSRLDQLIIELNRLVMDRARGERFITLFLGLVDTQKGTIQFVNAGHNAPLLWRQNAMSELTDGCIALGMLPELPFVKMGTATVNGGILLSYTDGLIEQEDVYGAAFDIAPLQRALQQFSGAGPKAVNDALIGTFEAHRAGLPYLDDIALLTCRFA
jgi:phosphoserine phosphatase RsbU/P